MSPMGLEGRCCLLPLLRKVFQNFLRHVCVVIRSKTGGLLSPSEAREPRVCADETTDPDCPEVKISLLQRCKQDLSGFDHVRWVLHRLVKVCSTSGQPGKALLSGVLYIV